MYGKLVEFWRSIPLHERIALLLIALVILLYHLSGYWVTQDAYLCHHVSLGMECWRLDIPR